MTALQSGSKIRFGVFRLGPRWSLCSHTCHLGEYPDAGAALAAGKLAARLAMSGGFDAELLVQSENGQVQRASRASFGH